MSVTPPPEDPEQTARVKKLQLETKVLERQLSPDFEKLERRKANAAIAAFLGPLVAVVGLVITSYQYLEATRRSSEAAANDRVARELEQLSSASIPARLTAVTSLASLVNEGRAGQHLVFQALVADLALEESPLVRSAILNTLRQPSTRAITKPELDALLDAALTMSRGVVQEGRLRQVRLHFPDNPPISPAEYRAQNVADAIQILLRHGARSLNFSGTYLWGADLRHLDLKAANFDGAILSQALFDGSNLTGASFNNAFLDATSFVAAQAPFTRFDQGVRADVPSSEAPMSYAGYQNGDFRKYFRPDQGFLYQGPRFDCADLRGATFRNHVLFMFSADDFWRFGTQTTSFRGAQLDNADLRTINVIGVAPQEQGAIPGDLFVGGGGGGSTAGGPYFIQAAFDIDAFPIAAPVPTDITRRRYATSIKALADAFAGAQWQRAKLPRPLATIFKSAPPAVSPPQPCATASH